MNRRLFPLLLLSVFLHCKNLTKYERGKCGNAVVEEGEDCDTFAEGAGRACVAPGGAFECRLSCGTVDATCPEGWGCSPADRICRRPTGTFERFGDSIPGGAWRTMMGDFDGDGRKDVVTRETLDGLGQSRLRVHFFERDGRLSTTTVIPGSAISPVVSDIDGNGTDDLAFAGLLGSIVLYGKGDRTLLPGVFPSFSVPEAGRLIPLDTRSIPVDTPFFQYRSGGAFGLSAISGLLLADPVDTELANTAFMRNFGLIPIFVLPKGPSELSKLEAIHEIATGNLIDNSQSPCDDVAIGYQRARKVVVFSPCVRAGQGTNTLNIDKAAIQESPPRLVHPLPPIEITIPGENIDGSLTDFQIDDGVRIGDVDGDGFPDVIVGTRGVRGENLLTHRVFVAFGNGTQFGSLPGGTGTPNQASSLCLRFAPPGEGMSGQRDGLHMVLAAGDLNGDGATDFVSSRYTLISNRPPKGPDDAGTDASVDAGPAGDPKEGLQCGSQTYFVGNAKTGSAWTDAVIADMNQNGLPDVVALSANALDLDFFNGVSERDVALNGFSIPVGGPVGHMMVNDIDGDLVPDIVFTQNGVGGAPTSSSLSVSYGRANGAPAEPKILGEFPNVDQVLPSFLGRDARAYITVLSRPREDRTEVALFFPSSERQPVSPLLMPFTTTKSQREFHLPVAVTAGTFSTPPSGQNALGLAGFSLESKNDGQEYSNTGRVWAAEPDRDAFGGFRLPVLTSELTLRRDENFRVREDSGNLRLLATSGDVDGDGIAELVGVSPAEKVTSSVIIVAQVKNRGLTPTFVDLPNVSVDDNDGQLLLHDLDGDGRNDILLIATDSTGAVNDEVVSLRVYWNEGGQFSGTRFTELSPPRERVQGLATLRLGQGSRPSLVFGKNREVFAVSEAGSPRTFQTTPMGIEAMLERRGVPNDVRGITGLAAGDIDGDGVDDLAVAIAGALELFRGLPEKP